MFEWLCMVAAFLPGCPEPRELVNARFPAVSLEQQHHAALESSTRELSRMSLASVGAGIPLQDAATLLMQTPALAEQGVKRLELEGQGPLVRVRVTFERAFSPRDASDNTSLSTLLGTLQPRVKGTVTVYAGMAATLSTATEPPMLTLKLLPAVSRVELDEVRLAGRWRATEASQGLVTVLERFKENISGALSASPLTQAILPALSDKALDFSQRFELSSGQTRSTIAATTTPAKVTLRLLAVAWLVEKEHVSALAQVAPLAPAATQGQPIPASAASSAEMPPPPGYEAFRTRFKQRLQQDLGLEAPPRGPWAAVRKDVLAGVLNEFTRQAAACVSGDVQMPAQHIDHTIRLPDGVNVNCEPTRHCSLDDCPWHFNEDRRDCSGLGKPICEVEKAAENTRRRAAATAEQGGCRLDAGRRKAQCEVVKDAEKKACEVGKAALNLLAKTGDFGRVVVDARTSSKELKVCLKEFALAPGLGELAFTLEASGSAQVLLDIAYTPLNVLGHVACYKPWSKQQPFEVSLRESRVGTLAKLEFTAGGDELLLQARTAPAPLKLRLQPSPAEFFLKTPELTLSCPLFAMVAPTLIALAPLVPPLAGEYDHTIEEQKLRIRLPLPQPNVGARKSQLRPTVTGPAIVVTASL